METNNTPRFIPMLFSTDMVLAIKNDTKTETRRIIKPQPDYFLNCVFGKPVPTLLKSGFKYFSAVFTDKMDVQSDKYIYPKLKFADGGDLEPQKVGLTTNFNKMQKSSINNETPAIGNVLLAAGVASKWKHYRDVYYRLYEVTKDIEGYEKSMKTHQTIINNWMETYNEELIESVTNICKQEDDARYQLKFLCAGYELASGVDYTCR